MPAKKKKGKKGKAPVEASKLGDPTELDKNSMMEGGSAADMQSVAGKSMQSSAVAPKKSAKDIAAEKKAEEKLKKEEAKRLEQEKKEQAKKLE